MTATTKPTTVEVPIGGMDCAECTRTVQRSLLSLPGVHRADVLLASQKAVIQLDPAQVDLAMIRAAVSQAGYQVPEPTRREDAEPATSGFTNQVLRLLGIVFGAVLFIVVAGEWLGLFDQLAERVPFPIGAGDRARIWLSRLS